MRRADLEGTIRSSASLEFAGTVDISHLADHTPPEISGDVMLVDLAGPSDSDWAALASLPVPVILLVDSTEPSEIAAALRSGVRGAIPWDATPQEIDGAVHIQSRLPIRAGDIVTVKVDRADAYDLFGQVA